MDYKQLLERYWVGETSSEEEKELKAYFASDAVEADLLPYKKLFTYWKEQRKQTLDSSLKVVEQATLKPINSPKVSLFRAQFPNYIRRIAASLVLLLTLGFLFQKYVEPTKEERLANYWISKEIKDPQIAYQKTKAALLLVSKKLNQGTEAAINQVQKVQQAGQFIKSPD